MFGPRKSTKQPSGMYIYCTPAEKERIKAAAKRDRRSLSAYCLKAILERVEHDERPSPRH